jgi:hypothetical protein
VYYGLASEFASEKLAEAKVAAAPHAEVAAAKAGDLYAEHLKEHVDKHVLPPYEEHVRPQLEVARAAVGKAVEDAAPIAEEAKGKAAFAVKHWHLSAVKGLSEAARLGLEKMPEGGEGGIESCLK